jgi:hypothetical protein
MKRRTSIDSFAKFLFSAGIAPRFSQAPELIRSAAHGTIRRTVLFCQHREET